MKSFFVAVLLACSAMAQVPRPAGALLVGGKNVLPHRAAVIAFVSTECAHCAAVAKLMQDVQKEFPGAYFAAVAAFSENPDIAAWSKKVGVTFPVFAADRQTALKFLGIPPDGRIATPQMVYIDKA